MQFFSQIPSPSFQAVSVRELSASMAWSPFIGLALGCLLAIGVFLSVWLMSYGLPAGILAAFLLIGWISFSKALHLDGIADFGDAWMGSFGSHERALKIMKDSRLGTGGVIALVLALVIKWQLLVVIMEQGWVWQQALSQKGWLLFLLLLSLTPAFARFTAWRMMALSPYVGQTAYHHKLFGYWSRSALKRANNRCYRLIGMLLSLLLLSAVGSFLTLQTPGFGNLHHDNFMAIGVVSLFATAVILLLLGLQMLWFRQFSKRLIGGINGDAIGTQIELSEITGLLLLVGFLFLL